MTAARRPGAGGLSEKAFQAQVVALAKVSGYRTYHTFDSRRSAAGFPDIVAVRPGRVVFAELKREGGRTTADQGEWLSLLTTVPGIEVYLWYPHQWEQIVAVLRGT